MAEPTLLDPEVAPAADLFAMPATPGQVRFWSLDRLNPGNPALNMPLMWQCSGPLDPALLATAFQLCIERHESLRTTFSVVGGKLAQILHPETLVELPLDDLSALSGENQRQEADRLTRAHAALRFALGTGPLLALRLLKLGPGSHLLLVTMHHIICDGISNGILLRDMLAFYRAGLLTPQCAGADAGLPELPIQFADYAVWHEQWSNSPDHEASLAFWREMLGTGFSPMRLPRDPEAPELLPPHRTSSTGDIQTLLIPPDLQQRAHSFCAHAGVTLNVLLFSTFCTLLARVTGSSDLTIGSPCANRTEDTENLIGLFMNIQVLRVRLRENACFEDVLRQVQRWSVAATDHQTLPFEDLLHDSFFAPSRGKEGMGSMEIPIFFLYQKSFMLSERILTPAGTLTVTPLRSESPGAVFEVMFAIVDREEEGPRLQLEYNPQFFTAATIQAQLRLFLSVLDAVLTAPAQPVRTLPLLSASSREATLTRGNDTRTDFGPFQAVSSAILAQAAAHPTRVAITCSGQSVSFGDLADRAKRLAATLVRSRVRPGDLVGICATRSIEMVVSVLGILLAGAAYLPLDPRHPPERLRAILADSGAQLVLTNMDAPPLPPDLERLRIDTPQPDTLEDGQTLPEPNADSLAYVLYTSGSTGEPKGVAIEHGSLRNLLLSMQREPGLTADDTFLAITTLAFDIATLELLLPLLTGARIVLATHEQAQSPELLLELLQSSGATVMQATPGAWRSLIDQGWSPDRQAAPSLKVLCGGDAMSRDLADQLLDRSSSVWNMYGPTETTIWSSATRMTRTAAAPRVGPPIANTQFYVLDEAMQPLPPGLTGELYIGGAGLARGYWRKPERTAASFVANPFSPASGTQTRLYRTGDCARTYPDGSIQILGRADFQVKVRGYRIELGEIEAALLRDPAIREAVVLQHRTPDLPAGPDHPATPGVTRLVAYVAAGEHAGAQLAPALAARLEANLQQTLPEYMIPNVLLAVESLPRNSNGKLDRRALPDPFTEHGDEGILAASGEDFVGPGDILERQLAELWQSTLGIDRISVRASFFSLGAGSLAALRLITRMNRIYSMDLGLASLISASSVESIAELIRNRLAANTSSTLVPLKPSGTRPPLFLVHGVGGNVLNFVGLSTRIDPAQPVYAIQAQSLLTGQPALLQLEDMAAFYLTEIRKLQPHGPYHLLGYSFGGFVVLEMAHQLRAAGEQVALLGMLDSRSKAYEERHRAELSVADRIDRRVKRARGNTESLPAAQRFGYLLGKVKTRALRLSSAVAATAHVRQLPAALKSAYDINYVALSRYQVRPYDGRMTLFRAAEQEFADGAADLGWGSTFSQGVDVHHIAGDHERIFLEPSIDQLAAAIRHSIEENPEP